MPKRIALTEEDLLTKLAEEVHHVIQTYVDGYAGIDLVTSPEELRSRVTDFVMNNVEVKETGAEQLRNKVRWAAQKYRRSLTTNPPNGYRQLAVALVNAAYNYITETNPDWNDETIDSEVDALIAEHDLDPAVVNELVESIY